MTMESSPQGKILQEGSIADRALLQSHFPTEWTNGNTNSSGPAFVTVRDTKQSKTEYTQTGSKTAPRSPFVSSDLQPENPEQKTGYLPKVENGISPVPSPSVKKETRSPVPDKTFLNFRSTTPTPIFTSVARQGSPKLERRDSTLSRGSSQQAKYHDKCNPQIDSALIIGNPKRSLSPRPRSRRPNSFRRPGSETSLLSRRESVTNLVFSGPSAIDNSEEDCSGWETVYKKRMSLGTFSYSSSLFSRMASPVRDVTPGEFDVVQDDDYSVTRSPKASPTSKRQNIHPCRPGFIYQVVSFDCLAKEVPNFVKNYAKKNGKLLTESFILKVNYLRRRRQLGEVTTTINIGNNNHKRPTTGSERLAGSPR